MTDGRALRCAIYTRKSTEEGLEQTFNTLDAQREACEAYIRSQASAGWEQTAQVFEDGGYSGGTLKRPAIQKLLGAVDAGTIDMIVVHRIDRLTRSLGDFMRIIERLDAAGASFVSVTQAFNTSTSTGRLMLNVLLSFAQFEREITGERIREKVAASKTRGMWMGGNPPLGYDLGEHGLVINENEAEAVRRCFHQYLSCRSGIAVVEALKADGIRTKSWVSRSGRQHGGRPFSTSNLYYLLQNRIYIGEVSHRGTCYPGLHQAIVDRVLFDQVQQHLARHCRERHRGRGRSRHCNLLGLVRDGTGAVMLTSFSYGRSRKLYPYYISRLLLEKVPGPLGQFVGRVPAAPLEELVVDRITRLLGDGTRASWPEVKRVLERVELHERSIQLVLRSEELLDPHEDIETGRAQLELNLATDALVVDAAGCLRVVCHRSPRFTGGRTWPRIAASSPARPMGVLLKSAHRLLEEHNMSPLDSERHSSARAPREKRHRRLMAIGLLAPAIQRDLLSGRASLSREQVLAGDLPLAWADQLEWFRLRQ